MNPMLKVAYDYGCRKCLADVGLIKTSTLADDWDEAGLIGENVPDGRLGSRLGHSMAGSALGVLGGGAAGIGADALLAAITKGKHHIPHAGIGGAVLGGAYGGYKGREVSRDNDSILDRLLLGLTKTSTLADDWDDIKDQLGDSYYGAKEHLYPLRKALGLAGPGDRLLDMLRSNSDMRGGINALMSADDAVSSATSDAWKKVRGGARDAWGESRDALDDLINQARG